MGNETPTTCHWLTPFMDLREKMRSLVEQDLKLYHGVFLTGPADPNDLSHLVDDLEGSRLASHVQTISFPVSDDAWAYHCFFTEDNQGFAELQAKLLDLDRWLKEVPQDILPKLKGTSLGQHPWWQLTKWVCVLYYLAWKYGDDILWAELEYSDSDVDVMWEPWSNYPASTVCDPRPLITLTPLEDESVHRWKPGVEVDGRKFPHVVSAYLDTDLLRASMQATLLLKCFGVDPAASTSPGMPPPPPPRKRRRGSPSVFKILRALTWHHGCGTDTRNNSPLDEEEIATKAGVSRSTVSHLLPKMIPGGVDKYRELCEKGEVQKHLERCFEVSSWKLRRGFAPSGPKGSPFG